MPGTPLTTPAAAAARLLLTGPRLVARGTPTAVGAAAGALAGTARAGVRAADFTTRAARTARAALPGAPHDWRAGPRAHVTLREAEPHPAPTEEPRPTVEPPPTTPRPPHHPTEHRAHRLAAALLEHPDVALAYWDRGLGRLVVTAAEGVAGDVVVERVGAMAGRYGLVPGDGDVEEFAHPGDPGAVRTAAVALGADVVGVVAAVGGSLLRLPASPRIVTAGVTLVRENPRVRAWLRGRLGSGRMEVVLAAANALAHGAGHSPASLVLDGALRVCQLSEAIARTAQFETVHDRLCVPERDSVPADPAARPPLRTSPAQEYAAHASLGSVTGALAALLVKHDITEAAEAVLAGSPKAARYGPAAFHAVLGTALARTGVLVRAPERLRQLETAGTIVLHPSALKTPDAGADPWAEAVLDAARRAGLRVVVVDDPALAEFTGLADRVVPADRSLSEVVRELSGDDEDDEDGGGVVTVARPQDEDTVAGLLAGDVAVALADGDGCVAWGADVLAPHGLPDVWRLLTAVPPARAVGRRAQTLARSGAALSGLLVAVGESGRGRRRTALPGLRHAPVDAAAAAALLSGARAALGVAAARPPHPRPRVPWHALGPDAVQDRLEREAPPEPTLAEQTSTAVRTAADTVVRLPPLAPARWSLQLARAVRGELDDPLTPVLAVGSAASAILGSAVDALLVVGALDLNALVGGVQRLRAERALSGLLAQQKQKARVTGDRKPHVVDAARLDPGDVIELKVDDVVPADARLLWEDGLEVDESALTGESLPVDKCTDPTPRAPVAERHCMVFEGTTVVAGQARAVVVDTGDRTEAARAVALAARTPPAAGVQARLQELTRKALPLTMAGGAAVTGLALLRGTPLKQAVSGGVAVAVAAVPEGLPLVATVAQLAAARRLSAHGVLVRAPRTLEAVGRMDTVCFDKTGTLTENRLRLVRVTAPDGTVRRPDEPDAAPVLRTAARACPGTNGEHATDDAILDAAGPDPDWTQTEGLAFEAARGYAAAVGHAGDGSQVLVVKGAPETVLPVCTGPADPGETAQSLARDGLRVLAVASRPLHEGEEPADLLEQPLDSLEDLEFTGLLGLADVPRATSPALVHGLREAGVRPVVLTGDHPQTARAIATELGWPDDATVVTGDELAAADRSRRSRMLRDADIVARVAPEQKLQVVEALRDAGRVVGMVGDGANDAAAIRAADVGVGINARGSAAARNAADLVVTGDDLSVLTEAVREGRALWHGVADAIAILIGGNAGEVSFGILGTLLSGAAPLSTRQMLLVNLFTDLFPAMAVAVTPVEATDDGPLGTAMLGAPLTHQIRRRAATTCLGATAAWLFGRFTPGTARRSTTMALCAVVGTQLAQTLADRRGNTLVRVTSLGSFLVLAAVVETPGVSQLFGCTPLGPVAWAGVGAAIGLALVVQGASGSRPSGARGTARSTTHDQHPQTDPHPNGA
ncbi:cation-translocating P-type ATPase [Streptomyces justiciae]|uniref:cation-translocating P-type ATPase n=1 Tax=Streptomyces justiciae TaxID=2780140 RepID=UPI0018826235|nr:cation-translocating P-type ATPase [Streptomyces justiciae]MBE8469949.1 cation-translocating P-type ATPase [Streptomyces justiciae]